ncbi:MAG: DUF5606 family protein [Chitinophagaceae bacterium]
MEYSKLVAVTGMPGLYELVNSKTDGAIVRSLEDNSTKFASSRIHNFSHLESIEVYTVRDNVNLVEIFHAMDKAGGSLPDGKDNGELKKYFEKTYPDLDFERVYASDLKKMVKWFEILKKQDIEIKLTEPVEEETVEEEKIEKESSAKSGTEEKPAKKPAKKVSAPVVSKKAEEKPAKEEKKEKKEKAEKKDAPAKPVAVKKKAEPKKESPVASKKEKEKVPKPARSEGGKKATPKKK